MRAACGALLLAAKAVYATRYAAIFPRVELSQTACNSAYDQGYDPCCSGDGNTDGVAPLGPFGASDDGEQCGCYGDAGMAGQSWNKPRFVMLNRDSTSQGCRVWNDNPFEDPLTTNYANQCTCVHESAAQVKQCSSMLAADCSVEYVAMRYCFNDCPLGFEEVSDVTDCRDARDWMGRNFGHGDIGADSLPSTEQASTPKGCYMRMTDSNDGVDDNGVAQYSFQFSVGFNSHGTGAARCDGQYSTQNSLGYKPPGKEGSAFYSKVCKRTQGANARCNGVCGPTPPPSPAPVATAQHPWVGNRKCLSICQAGQQACGDSCVAAGATCQQEAGHACNFADLERCTRICSGDTSKPCGNSCINNNRQCHVEHDATPGRGGACRNTEVIVVNNVNVRGLVRCADICSVGKVCGDACIDASLTCHTVGRACDDDYTVSHGGEVGGCGPNDDEDCYKAHWAAQQASSPSRGQPSAGLVASVAAAVGALCGAAMFVMVRRYRQPQAAPESSAAAEMLGDRPDV